MRCLLCLLAIAACGDPQPTLEVRVTAETGDPIGGAVVAVVCDPVAVGGSARTTDDGTAHITVFTKATTACIVTASHPGFDPLQLRDVTVCPAEQTCEPLVLALVLP